MFAKKSKSRVCLWAASLALILAMTLLLSACAENAAPTGSSASPSTAAIPTDSTPAPADSTPAPTETETEAPETERPTVEWKRVLNQTDISFFGPGESFQLFLPEAPADLEVLWSSEEPEIAAVSENGRVTAVGPGSTRIIAEIGEETLHCWIRCQFSAVPGEDEPALDKTDISFFGVGESYRFTLRNVPEDAEVVWSSEDYGVASVDENGRVTAVGPGTIRVTARVDGLTLSSWVRCQFAATELPRSSVADGSWLVQLRKDRITALDEEGGVYIANAVVQIPVQVPGLTAGGQLDLSAFGLGIREVESIEYDPDQTACTVTTSSGTLRFVPAESGAWKLLGEDGEPMSVKGGDARLVFNGDSVFLDQVSAAAAGRSEPIPRENLLDLFDKQPDAGDELNAVSVTVAEGVVTRAIWYGRP